MDRETVNRIRDATEALGTDPRPAGATMVKGMPGVMRIRVGDYRVLYRVLTVDEQPVVQVIGVGHRREVYRRMR